MALLFVGFIYVRSTPHYSLYLLKQAVENHNPDEALRYVNIDSIVDNLGKGFFGQNERGGNQGARGKSPLKEMMADNLPGIKDAIRTSFRDTIASHGKDNQKTVVDTTESTNEATDKRSMNNAKDLPREKNVLQLHKNESFSVGGIAIGNLDVRKIREISLWDLVIEKDGKTAIIHTKSMPNIKAKMAKTDGGYWQVVEIILSP